jgi:ubiquitin-protein ligase
MESCVFTDSNCVVPEFKQKETLVKFIIKCAIATITSPRCAKIMKTIPPSWIERGIPVDKAIEILDIIVNADKIIQSITTASNDEMLIKTIGIETYGFIKFILSINKAINVEYCKLIYDTCIDTGNDTCNNSGNAEAKTSVAGVKLSLQEKRFKQFRLTYAADIESRFASNTTVYRYHGTNVENLTPIMINGLKNCSGTDLMINGAAYGNGIYLADNINLSLGYCSGSIGGQIAMLIYEVIDNPRWLKTSGIYVVDDESALILRYLIIIKSDTFDQTVFKHLDTLLNSGKLKAKELEKASKKEIALTKAYNKRLMMEYRKIANTSPDLLGFTVHLANDDNLRVWIIRIMKIDNPVLEEQMCRLNIPYVELEVSFPEGYPIDPPFPRILYPRFQSLTGHITIGGSICMEAISSSGWVPTTNMEALIMQIKLVLCDGKARIDEAGSGTRYGMAEAKEAFKRAMAVHGW